jgi:hypothetical protein
MIIQFLRKATPIILLIVFLVPFSSCRTNTLSSKEKQIQREKKRRVKEDSVLYEKALKKHMKSQTKATRQEMKRNYRDAQRHNNQKQEFFLKRFVREKLYQRQKKQKG